MNASVRQLFSELVDLPPADRKLILHDRGVPPDVCAELEALLAHDAQPGAVTRRVSGAMKEAFCPAAAIPKCGPYRLVSLIGSGGMGSVYLARREDGEIDHQVAVKLLRADADRPAWRERFLRERQVLASLNHPSIARLLDAGHTADGRPYLVMEFVEGVPVDEYAWELDFRRGLELFLQICDAVSHAHRHAIIHRDLKPSNILVDPSGRPKLLDFGIAKALDKTTDQTGTVDRLLTPAYASPEQLCGAVQSVATDVYSLGAVLYKLLTGSVHRQSISDDVSLDWDGGLVPPSRLKPDLPRDIDYIVLKALRGDPASRYVSVEALAEDVRRVLESRPVHARSGNLAYRMGTFLRRNRTAAAGAVVAIASLCLTTAIANHQRDNAKSRVEQGRRLASRILTLNESRADIYDSSKTGYELVALSKDYLEGLSAAARGDRNLSLELGRAYSLLARAQGITLTAPTGQTSKAKESLRKADTLVEPVVRARPHDREALLTAARISHDLMVIAETEHRNEEALAQGRKVVQQLDTLFSIGGLSADQTETAADWWYQIALTHKNLERFDDGIRFSRRAIEIARLLPDGSVRMGLGLSLLADLLRVTGDMEGALQVIKEARMVLKLASFPSDTARRFSWMTILWRESKILGAANGLGLNRPAEAIPVLQDAFDLLEDWVRHDSASARSRLTFATIGRELGELLRVESPQRSLAVYESSLLRLREISDNTEARRGEAVMLAGSAYALRRLGRAEEAGRRIESAFQMLRSLGDYPGAGEVRNSAVESVLHAFGDHLAETGDLQRAAEVLEDALARMERSKPNARRSLRHAVALSEMYGSLSAIYRKARRLDSADSMADRRLALWRDWDRKLPGNRVIERQLELAGAYRNQGLRADSGPTAHAAAPDAKRLSAKTDRE